MRLSKNESTQSEFDRVESHNLHFQNSDQSRLPRWLHGMLQTSYTCNIEVCIPMSRPKKNLFRVD